MTTLATASALCSGLASSDVRAAASRAGIRMGCVTGSGEAGLLGTGVVGADCETGLNPPWKASRMRFISRANAIGWPERN